MTTVDASVCMAWSCSLRKDGKRNHCTREAEYGRLCKSHYYIAEQKLERLILHPAAEEIPV